MKKTLLFFVCVCSSNIFSQDTLFFVNGEKQTAKIKEINSTQIKYLKFDNLNGPTYSLNKSDIAIIKYSGGQIDSLNVIEPPKVVVSEPKVNNKLIYYGASIMHNSEKISNDEFVSLINNYPDEMARKKMQHSYKQMIGHRDIATASLSCGLIFGCVIVVATAPFITGLTDAYSFPTQEGMQVAVIGILSGAAMRITGFAVSQSQRNKRKAKIREIVSVYNGDYDFKK